MAVRVISTRLAIEGESQYKQSITNINNALKTLKSELALVESQYRGNANSMEALEAKGAVLSRTHETQQQKVSELAKALENAKKAQELHGSSIEEYRNKIVESEKKLEELKGSTGDTAEAQKELTDEIKKYKEAQADAESKQAAATKGVDNWQRQVNYAERDLNELNHELALNRKYLDEAKNSTDGVATSIDAYGKKVKESSEQTQEFRDKSHEAVGALASALAAAGIAKAFTEIKDAIKECTDASIEFESAITGVFKTVEGTPEQLAAVTQGIKDMALEIPASTTEIAAIAEAAGQLGIATDDVLSFSRVMIDLGESTNLSADEAASSLAKFANITQMSASDYERLGSVIVDLGNNFATTEADIVQMGTRLASTGAIVGLSEAEIMALATAMSSVGIEAEAGGTAMTQTLTAIERAVALGGEKLEKFAQIAGVTSREFSEAWKTNSLGALQGFIVGLSELEEKGQSTTLVLDELGLTGVRQSNMIKSLALSAEGMGNAVGVANSAWAENNALAEEAGKRYATLESQLAIAGNAATNLKMAVGDVLVPALRDMAEAGTGAMIWAAEFVEENPWVVSALSAVAAVLGTLTLAVTGYTLALKVVIPLVHSFNAAIAASPAGKIALAVSVLISAIGALALTTRGAANETEEFTKKLNESKEAYAETADAMRQETDSILGAVDALEKLAEKANRTAAEKEVLLSLVDQLNEKVPRLALAYDEQTDSINLNAEAVRTLALAEAERAEQEAAIIRLKEATVEHAEVTSQLAEATAELTAIDEEWAAMSDSSRVAMMSNTAQARLWSGAKKEAEKNVKALTEAEKSLSAELQTLSKDYDAYIKNAEEATAAGGDQQKQAISLSAAVSNLSAETQSLTGSEGKLTVAFKEQRDAGELNLDTILSLIDSGYANMLVVDEETGAVRLNTEEYIRQTQAKIDAHTQSLLIAIAGEEAAVALVGEAGSALDAAKAYLLAAEAKGEYNEAQVSFAAQIAALEKTRASLGSYSSAVTTAARATRQASSSVKTQAQKDLEAFKKLQATLEHERAMGQKSEEEYYSALKEYRDRYLTNDKNIDTFRNITESIYQYEQSLLDQQLENYEDHLSAMANESNKVLEEIQEAYNKALRQQDDMISKLAGYGELFEVDEKKSRVTISNLEEQIDVLNRYEETLTALRERGISDSLLDEVIGMGVDDALSYGGRLLQQTDTQWEEYNTLWEEKQKRAKEIAEEFFRNELDTLKTDFNDKLADALDGLKDTSFKSGAEAGQGLLLGLESKEDALYRKAKQIADNIALTIKKALDIQSPSRVMMELGAYTAQGLEIGFSDEIKNFSDIIAASLPKTLEAPSQRTRQEAQTAAIVNAISTLGAGQSQGDAGGDLVVIVPVNGTDLARATIKDFRRVDAQSPEIRSDFLKQ